MDALISGTGTMTFGKAGLGSDSHRVLRENTFTGQVTITEGHRVAVTTPAAFGAAGNALLLDNGGIEADSQAPGPVVISGAVPLTIGAGGASFGSNGKSLIIEALLAGDVPIRLNGGGADYEVRFTNPANTFSGNLAVGTNDLGSAVLGIVADGSLGNAGNAVTLGYQFFDGESTRTGSGTLRAFANMVLPATRALRMDGSDQDGGGIFDTNGFNLTVAGPLTELHAGTPLRKTGTGTLTLNGSNTHTGVTTIEAGTLVVNGSLGGETQVLSSGKLSGTGTTGNVSVSFGGTLAPGNSSGTLGTRNVTFSDGSALALDFSSPASTSQLAVTGSITLNADVELSFAPGFIPAAASTFVVIANDGTDPIETFGGATAFTIAGNQLSEGETFSAGGATWKISYVGGTGNDVTLSMDPGTVAAELKLVSFNFGIPAGGASGKQIQGSVSGPPSAAVRMERSSDLIDWTPLTTFNLNESGTATFDLTDPLATDRAFYRISR